MIYGIWYSDPTIGKGPYWKYHISDKKVMISAKGPNNWEPNSIVTPAVGRNHDPYVVAFPRLFSHKEGMGLYSQCRESPSCWWEDQGSHIYTTVGSNSMKVGHTDKHRLICTYNVLVEKYPPEFLPLFLQESLLKAASSRFQEKSLLSFGPWSYHRPLWWRRPAPRHSQESTLRPWKFYETLKMLIFCGKF